MKGLAALGLLAALAVLPAGAAGLQDPADGGRDDQAIELRSDLVLVNVVASRGEGFASGLRREDFSVAEDGVAQHIEFFGAEDTAFACAILLDTSGSMEPKLTLARAAAARFLDSVRPKDQIGIWSFSDKVRALQPFVPAKRVLTDDLWDTDAEGPTKMYDCIGEAAAGLAARAEQRRALLLISDGFDQGSRLGFDAALRAALDAGATLYAIDLAPMGARGADREGALRGKQVMKSLADKTGGRYFASSGGEDLRAAFGAIVDELGHQYTIGYYSSNERPDGKWRKIAVTTPLAGVSLRARGGYTAGKE